MRFLNAMARTTTESYERYSDQKVKEIALEHIVKAILELEAGRLREYSITTSGEKIKLYRTTVGSGFSIEVFPKKMVISWMSYVVRMNRAETEEEYFQLMCLDDTYCDVEFEKGIKELIDLHNNYLIKRFAIGGYLEGAHDNQPNS